MIWGQLLRGQVQKIVIGLGVLWHKGRLDILNGWSTFRDVL